MLPPDYKSFCFSIILGSCVKPGYDSTGCCNIRNLIRKLSQTSSALFDIYCYPKILIFGMQLTEFFALCYGDSFISTLTTALMKCRLEPPELRVKLWRAKCCMQIDAYRSLFFWFFTGAQTVMKKTVKYLEQLTKLLISAWIAAASCIRAMLSVSTVIPIAIFMNFKILEKNFKDLWFSGISGFVFFYNLM